MRPFIFFDQYTVKSFIDKNNRVKKMFEDTEIDKDILWNKYKKEVEEEVKDIIIGPEDDPSIIYDIYQSKMEDVSELFWHIIPMHTYQFITILFHTFENQLTSYINNEIKRYNPTSKIYNYSEIVKMIMKKVGPKDLSGTKEINELRLLNNTIKHGNGVSADQLRKLRPEYFTNKEFNFFGEDDLLDNWNSVYENSIALNVSKDNFYVYQDSINDFWNSLPTRIYLDDLTPKFK